MMEDSPNRVWITGASSGIGAALARELTQRGGYRLLLLARRVDRLEALAQELDADFAALDLADAAALSDAIMQLRQRFGAPAVLINNAGLGQYQAFLQSSEADAQQLMQVNYHAPALLMRRLLPDMLTAGRGHIINIASIAATFGPWGHGSYAAAKAALIALTQTLAVEHRHTGVHFSYVKPGVIRTEFFDDPAYAPLQPRVQRYGMPVELAARRICKLLTRPRLTLHLPAHYRLADVLAAALPQTMARIVWKHSHPH